MYSMWERKSNWVGLNGGTGSGKDSTGNSQTQWHQSDKVLMMHPPCLLSHPVPESSVHHLLPPDVGQCWAEQPRTDPDRRGGTAEVRKQRSKRETVGERKAWGSEAKGRKKIEKVWEGTGGNRALPWQHWVINKVNLASLPHLNNNLDVRQR